MEDRETRVYKGEVYVRGLHGVPDFPAHEYSKPEDWFWKEGTKKEENDFLHINCGAFDGDLPGPPEAPKTELDDTEKIFIVTDECMWEKNRVEGKTDPHAIGVVDPETGKTRYINGGSKIRFVEGEISKPRSQEDYNNK